MILLQKGYSEAGPSSNTAIPIFANNMFNTESSTRFIPLIPGGYTELLLQADQASEVLQTSRRLDFWWSEPFLTHQRSRIAAAAVYFISSCRQRPIYKVSFETEIINVMVHSHEWDYFPRLIIRSFTLEYHLFLPEFNLYSFISLYFPHPFLSHCTYECSRAI